MKKVRFVSFCMTIFIVFYVLSFSEEKIRIASGEWVPLVSEKLKNNGIVSEIITEALKSEGVKVEYGFFPWKRSFEIARLGEWDGTVLWSKNPEREKDFYFSEEALYISKNVFFYLKDKKFDWKNPKDLEKLRIGVIAGYFYGENFESMKKEGKLTIIESPNEVINFRNLLSGRLDLFVCEYGIGNEMLQKQFSPEETLKIVSHKNVIAETGEYFILSKKNEKNKDIMEKFNIGLKKLKKSGKYSDYFKNNTKY